MAYTMDYVMGYAIGDAMDYVVGYVMDRHGLCDRLRHGLYRGLCNGLTYGLRHGHAKGTLLAGNDAGNVGTTPFPGIRTRQPFTYAMV